MNNNNKDDCLTCDYTREYGYKHFICIHPDLAKKYQRQVILIGKKGHPSWCPIAKNFDKAWKQWRDRS